jgi:hypothetical protein
VPRYLWCSRRAFPAPFLAPYTRMCRIGSSFHREGLQIRSRTTWHRSSSSGEYFRAALTRFYLDVTVHDSVAVKHANGFADLPENLADDILAHITALDLFEKGATVGVLQHHISDILLFLVVVVEELHDARVVQPLVQRYLILGVFVIDLSEPTLYQFYCHEVLRLSVARQLYLSVTPEPDVYMVVLVTPQELV